MKNALVVKGEPSCSGGATWHNDGAGGGAPGHAGMAGHAGQLGQAT